MRGFICLIFAIIFFWAGVDIGESRMQNAMEVEILECMKARASDAEDNLEWLRQHKQALITASIGEEKMQ